MAHREENAEVYMPAQLAKTRRFRGLLRRTHDGINRREVTLAATPAGIRMMEDQASASRAELREIGPVLFASLQRLMEEAPPEVLAKVKFNTDSHRRKTMKR